MSNDFDNIHGYLLQKINDVDELYYINTNEELLVEKLKILLFTYSTIKNLKNYYEYGDRIYLLYAGIVDDIISISKQKELEEFVENIGLLSLEEYFYKKKLIKYLKN